MVFYAIFDTDIVDAPAYEDYKTKVSATITVAGGKHLARGGDFEVIEGNWDLHRVVLLEFPDKAAFDSWYDGPAYAPLKGLRARTVRTNAFTFAGI